MSAISTNRVGVLTLHYGSNHGAILQCLSTTKLFDGEVIDHRYQTKCKAYAKSGLHSDHLQKFIDEELRLSPQQFATANFGEQRSLRFIRKRYDLVVFGSDEIWKVSYGGGSRRSYISSFFKNPYQTLANYAWRQRNPFYTPFPNIYWPAQNGINIAFAGSIGESKTESIPGPHLRLMAERLQRFQLIGVRDTKTLGFFQKLAPHLVARMSIVPDPVFAFQCTEADRASAASVLHAIGIDPNRPFAFVNIGGKEKEKQVDAIRELGYPVADLLALPLTPPQWFAAIGMAKCGVTSAMHALISSLVQGTPCFSIDQRFKSIELKRDFGIDQLDTIQKVVRNWPREAIAAEATRRSECVRDFVQQALGLARRSAT